MAKGKPATSGKTRVGSSITSSPSLSWQWLMPHDKRAHVNAAAAAHAVDYSNDRTAPRFNFVSSLRQNLTEMFLPVGYPESVHRCYKPFHKWLAIETYVGSAIGVLCSQAMLASLGLGTAEATGGAVAIQWVLKDGIGELGKLFFIKRFASSFDSHPKTWKIVSVL
ncbi:vitamin B6 photo-protection and homoeostasis-domain-containing protein [Syncephalastrum racemosum]|uniref:Vitamin B6 photo-protection and homoeostasis-domain-containing protein n=1 Tax=Syncephalastrum racemosum TaxID=13706 RepID=A0A1X2HF73_SYNRA|nr:vitamin B6 photo-protection and homoeostasis-domain-containing protein [Syncephalastrum racemosum]